MSRPRRLLAAGMAVLLAGACSVPNNDEPVELSGSIVPETTTSTSTTSPETATREAAVYMIEATEGGTVLRRVPRTIPAGTGIQGVLSNLFTQRPQEDVELERGLTSAIPESAALLSAALDSNDPNLLVVDVRGLFGPEGLQGASLRDALGQIVWTATEGAPDLRVAFRQEGERRSALVDNLESTDDAVVREDYERQL